MGIHLTLGHCDNEYHSLRGCLLYHTLTRVLTYQALLMSAATKGHPGMGTSYPLAEVSTVVAQELQALQADPEGSSAVLHRWPQLCPAHSPDVCSSHSVRGLERETIRLSCPGSGATVSLQGHFWKEAIALVLHQRGLQRCPYPEPEEMVPGMAKRL